MFGTLGSKYRELNIWPRRPVTVRICISESVQKSRICGRICTQITFSGNSYTRSYTSSAWCPTHSVLWGSGDAEVSKLMSSTSIWQMPLTPSTTYFVGENKICGRLQTTILDRSRDPTTDAVREHLFSSPTALMGNGWVGEILTQGFPFVPLLQSIFSVVSVFVFIPSFLIRKQAFCRAWVSAALERRTQPCAHYSCLNCHYTAHARKPL